MLKTFLIFATVKGIGENQKPFDVMKNRLSPMETQQPEPVNAPLINEGGETVEDIIKDRFYKVVQRIISYVSPVKHRIDYMESVTPFTSQNIMKALNEVGFNDVATLRIHKLMFHAEELSKSGVLDDLKKLRVDIACARHRDTEVTTLQTALAEKDKRIEGYKPKDSLGETLNNGDVIRINWNAFGDYTDETISYSQKYSYWMYGNNPLCELQDPEKWYFKLTPNNHQP